MQKNKLHLFSSSDTLDITVITNWRSEMDMFQKADLAGCFLCEGLELKSFIRDFEGVRPTRYGERPFFGVEELTTYYYDQYLSEEFESDEEALCDFFTRYLAKFVEQPTYDRWADQECHINTKLTAGSVVRISCEALVRLVSTNSRVANLALRYCILTVSADAIGERSNFFPLINSEEIEKAIGTCLPHTDFHTIGAR